MIQISHFKTFEITIFGIYQNIIIIYFKIFLYYINIILVYNSIGLYKIITVKSYYFTITKITVFCTKKNTVLLYFKIVQCRIFKTSTAIINYVLFLFYLPQSQLIFLQLLKKHFLCISAHLHLTSMVGSRNYCHTHSADKKSLNVTI